MPSALTDIVRDDMTGRFRNTRLQAPNVFTVSLEPDLISEAAAIFERCDLRAVHARLNRKAKHSREQIEAQGYCFFAHHSSWASDVAWISADDQLTYDTFHSIFKRMGLAEAFRDIIGGATVHLYSAFFVVRTICEKPNMHVDYGEAVGTTALTLMTPLYAEYSDVPDFQLVYRTDEDGSLRQYRYRHGEAIVFGSDFQHSTEPGHAALDEALHARKAHAYLCFCFGSSRQEHWEAIAETIDGNQSRTLSRPPEQPGGAPLLSLSKLGRALEAGEEPSETWYGAEPRVKLPAGTVASTSSRPLASRRRPRSILK